MNQYKCPISGCDYAAESKGSVKGHITRSTSNGHKGKSGPEMDDEIRAGDVDEQSDPPERQAPVDSDGSTGTVEFPEAEEPVADPRDQDDPPEECPGCGGDLRPVPAGAGFTAQDGRSGVTEHGDAQCVGCSAIVTADGEVYE